MSSVMQAYFKFIYLSYMKYFFLIFIFTWNQSAFSQPAIKVDEATSGMTITFNDDYVFTKGHQTFYIDTASEFSNTKDQDTMRSRVYAISPNEDVLVKRGTKAYIGVVWTKIKHEICAKSKARTFGYTIYITKVKSGFIGLSKDEFVKLGPTYTWDKYNDHCAGVEDFYRSEEKVRGVFDFKSSQQPLSIEIEYVKGDRDSFLPLKDFLSRCCGINVSIERDRASMKTF